MTKEKVTVVEKIMNANDKMAFINREILEKNNIFAINVMASPGAGKTSIILETIKRLSPEFVTGVIEGDTAPVTIDADKITAIGSPAVQINTGGECHLDAISISNALDKLPLEIIDFIIVENVGNLICPAGFMLGTHANVLIASVPEGDDKPYKYPNIYRDLDALIINKIDLLPFVTYNLAYFQAGVNMLNKNLSTFVMSAKTGEGFDEWIAWVSDQIRKKQSALK